MHIQATVETTIAPARARRQPLDRREESGAERWAGSGMAPPRAAEGKVGPAPPRTAGAGRVRNACSRTPDRPNCAACLRRGVFAAKQERMRGDESAPRPPRGGHSAADQRTWRYAIRSATSLSETSRVLPAFLR